MVVVTECFPENEKEFIAYETKLRLLVADQARPLGWVVDLCGNVGGNMWPMLTGIDPLLGEGDDLGEFFQHRGTFALEILDGLSSDETIPATQKQVPDDQATVVQRALDPLSPAN